MYIFGILFKTQGLRTFMKWRRNPKGRDGKPAEYEKQGNR